MPLLKVSERMMPALVQVNLSPRRVLATEHDPRGPRAQEREHHYGFPHAPMMRAAHVHASEQTPK